MNKADKNQLARLAAEIRLDAVGAVHAASSGHPGGALSAADMVTYLYFKEMNVDPKNLKDDNRDRFILSKGHCCPSYYAALAHKGYFSRDELKNFRQSGHILRGHPDMKKIPGVDFSAGSLGQGLSAACGIALAAKLDNKDYRTYVICGDGEIQEGQIWEAAMFAGFRKLDNLCVFIDNNNLQIDGAVDEVCSPYPIDKKFEAFGFNVINIDGHDFDQIADALDKARATKGMPTAIVAKTVKGKGVSFMENNVNWHGKSPSDEEYETAKKELGAVIASLEV